MPRRDRPAQNQHLIVLHSLASVKTAFFRRKPTDRHPWALASRIATIPRHARIRELAAAAAADQPHLHAARPGRLETPAPPVHPNGVPRGDDRRAAAGAL